ncbi:MAG TPA: hypothetical protein VJA27_01765 [Patescibacteria group bacterium]|nr:hypothetical protein [Patescibacteria group bacterium]
MGDIHRELEQLLDELFILDYHFRERLRTRVGRLDARALQNLKTVLTEMFALQQKKLLETLRDNPASYEKFKDTIAASDQELLGTYRDVLAKEDEEKIQQLLTKLRDV